MEEIASERFNNETGVNLSISIKGSENTEGFSILIPTWNNLPYLQLCVKSLRTNSDFRHQIIIHINDGQDGTLEWAKKQQDIEFTYSSENIGICYALNISRTLVRNDYILYLNDDMYVCPHWDSELRKEVDHIHHKYFFLSATLIEPLSSNRCVISKNYGTDIKNFKETELLDEYNTWQKSDWLGSTWPPNLVHKDLWDLVGGYSIEFSPGMYSDPDFSMKLWMAGVRLFKGVSHSRVYHFGSKTTARITKNNGYYTFIGKWGMTSSMLTKNYLRIGAAFNGELKEPSPSTWQSFKNKIKRISGALKTNNQMQHPY